MFKYLSIFLKNKLINLFIFKQRLPFIVSYKNNIIDKIIYYQVITLIFQIPAFLYYLRILNFFFSTKFISKI